MTAADALVQVEEEHGVAFSLVGRCPGGEVGAHYADAADGRRFVFKWSDDPSAVSYFERVVGRVETLRRRGYLTPRYLTPFRVDGGVVVLQEAAEGRWRDEVPHHLVETAFRLNDLQAGQADTAGNWTDYIRMTLTDGADGYCLHAPLRTHSDAARRLVEWVESVGRSHGPLPEGDLVHLDFHHRNMLRERSHLVAVIDWEGCRPGDRTFDLVTFCFGMTHAQPESGVENRVWERASELASADALAAYVAHMSLRRVDWSIRHHPDEVDHVLQLACRYAGQVA